MCLGHKSCYVQTSHFALASNYVSSRSSFLSIDAGTFGHLTLIRRSLTPIVAYLFLFDERYHLPTSHHSLTSICHSSKSCFLVIDAANSRYLTLLRHALTPIVGYPSQSLSLPPPDVLLHSDIHLHYSLVMLLGHVRCHFSTSCFAPASNDHSHLSSFWELESWPLSRTFGLPTYVFLRSYVSASSYPHDSARN